MLYRLIERTYIKTASEIVASELVPLKPIGDYRDIYNGSNLGILLAL
jgi:hypothetical protein